MNTYSILNEEVLNHPLLQDYYSINQAEVLQLKWSLKREEIEKKAGMSWNIKDTRWIASVDISYPKIKDPTWGLACAVLWDYKTNKMLAHKMMKGDLKFPYLPGLLGFRETKLMAMTLLKLPEEPDVIMCDGHGLAHPLKFGEAVHLGIALNIPSFGVAKNPFYGISKWKELRRIKGIKTPIWPVEQEGNVNNDKTRILGHATCLANDRKPVFISQGFMLSLDDALRISLNTTLENRQPEPLFLADHLSREKLKK